MISFSITWKSFHPEDEIDDFRGAAEQICARTPAGKKTLATRSRAFVCKRLKMGSEYLSSLSNEDKVHYDRKLTLANGVKLDDPYSTYLVDTPSAYTKESVKAFKSLDGFEFLEKGMCRTAFIMKPTQCLFASLSQR